MTALRKAFVLSIAMLAMASDGVFAATSAPAPKSSNSTLAAGNRPDLQKLIDQFKARRDVLLANHEALLNQLKNATAEQRNAILEKMQAQQKELMDAQRALGRQLRDELRKLRQATPGGPGRH